MRRNEVSNLSPQSIIFITIFALLGVSFLAPEYLALVLLIPLIYIVATSFVMVRSQEVAIVERLGKYQRNLEAGLSFIVPFIDRVAYRTSLKEINLVVSPQPCFTKDNLRVMVNGILYYKVFDAKKAAYSIENFQLATVQLAQTSMRSVIGQMLLDQTFQDRENINRMIILNLDEASANWGIKVTRYEIQEIGIPTSISEAMEYQVKAERDKRAMIANSEGEKTSKINHSQGQKIKMINISEGAKAKAINEAEGKAFGIRAVSEANAYNLEKILSVLNEESGDKAFGLDLASQYIKELSSLADKKNQVVLPLTLTDLTGLEEQFNKILNRNK